MKKFWPIWLGALAGFNFHGALIAASDGSAWFALIGMATACGLALCAYLASP